MPKFKAFCYLYKQGDERNKCALTVTNLIITHKGTETNYPLKDLYQVKFHEKKLLLPVIAGGIVASLGLAANLSGYYNPWLTMSVSIAGIYLFYFGWSGTWTLSLDTSLGNKDYYLKGVSLNLKAFVSYLNYLLLEEPEGFNEYTKFYYLCKSVEWQQVSSNQLSLNQQKVEIKLLTYDQMLMMQAKLTEEEILLMIDPDKLNSEIRFQIDKASGYLFPIINGEIPFEAITVKI